MEKMGPIGLIYLDSPDTANAFDLELGSVFLSILKVVDKDKTIRVCILTGRGKTFCAGANLWTLNAEMKESGQPPAGILHKFSRFFNRVSGLMAMMDIPVIAAVNGPATGGGMALALTCDLVLASSTAYFDPTFMRLGLPPLGGLSFLLPEMMGSRSAAELLYRAKPVDADRALSLGLINRVVPPEELMPQAMTLAGEIAEVPPLVLARTKRLLKEQNRAQMVEAMEREIKFLEECGNSQEHQERLTRLLKKLR